MQVLTHSAQRGEGTEQGSLKSTSCPTLTESALRALSRAMPWTWKEDNEGFRSKLRAPQGIRGNAAHWGHRKPEWECPNAACLTRNFLHLGACRACGQAWRPGLVHHPAGTAPPPRRPPTQSAVVQAPAASGKKAGSEDATTPIKAAERALAEARAANLPVCVVEQMELELANRRAAQQAQKPLPVQLQEATRKAEDAKSALSKAQDRLAKVQEEVRAAQQASDAAAQNLRNVTAALSAAQDTAKPPAQDALHALTKLLEMVKSLTAPTAELQSAREALAQAVTAAESALPQPCVHQPPLQGEKRGAGGEPPSPSQDTVIGTQEVTSEEVDELLGEMESMQPEAKKKRLAALLAQGRAVSQQGM